MRFFLHSCNVLGALVLPVVTVETPKDHLSYWKEHGNNQ